MADGVIWYGERGIVNALVTDLASSKDVAGGVKRLLTAVRWAGDIDRVWIQSVTGVAFLVEIGMGQFGNPDLILVCRSAPGCPPHVVFLEAQVVPYLESAVSNPSTLAARGYNSSINGQLVLRHRLAHALSGWRAGNVLSEPAGLHAAYRRPPGRQGGLGDPLPRPRQLLKPAVLDLVREQGLGGLPLDHYHLAAWTWDRGPFFAPDAAVPDDLMSVLLTPGGEDAWNETRGRIGWLGFEQVRDSVCPSEGYTRAVATMLPTLVPSVTTTTAETGEPLVTENFARFSEATVRLVGEIEELARLSFGKRSVERGSGSSSVTIAGQVRLKVIPSDPGGEEHVVLGIRATLSPQDWCPHRLAGPRLIGVGDRRRGFFLLEPVGGAEESLRVAAEVFELLAQRFPAGERA